MVTVSIQEYCLVSVEALAAGAFVGRAPTDIFPDFNSVLEVLEAADNGDSIAWLGATDPDEAEIFTFSLIDNAGGRFGISELGQLVVTNGALIDYEKAQSHTITVRVTDRTGLKFDKSLVIKVIDSGSDGKGTGPLLVGSDGADTLSGTAGDDTINGVSGNDILEGFAGNDILRGESGDDVLRGGDGDDWLFGHDGRDVLFGGKGVDRFVFDTKPGSKNIDKIADFSVRDDTIYLDSTYMKKLGSPVGSLPLKLKKTSFVIGDKAKDANDYIVYDDKKGVLYYDSNGSSAGGAVTIATLSKKLKMTAADFLIY